MNQQLLDSQGRRKYFTPDERRMFMAASINAPREVRSLCAVLHDTGCRISEALALTVKDIDLAERRIVIKCLKKKNGAIVYRKVPVPPELLDMLDMVHGLRQLRQKRKFNEPLWTWSRMHAWRMVHAVIQEAGIEEGPHASPKGLRHGFGIAAVDKGIALNMLQKWLGHAQMSTTAIYADASGEEEENIASRMWA
jgi:integrase/recombinase XerD